MLINASLSTYKDCELSSKSIRQTGKNVKRLFPYQISVLQPCRVNMMSRGHLLGEAFTDSPKWLALLAGASHSTLPLAMMALNMYEFNLYALISYSKEPYDTMTVIQSVQIRKLRNPEAKSPEIGYNQEAAGAARTPGVPTPAFSRLT